MAAEPPVILPDRGRPEEQGDESLHPEVVESWEADEGQGQGSEQALHATAAQGESRESAIANIREAIEGYVLALQDDGLGVPEERFEAMLVAV